MVSQHLKTLVMFSISIASVTLLIYLIVSPPGVSSEALCFKETKPPHQNGDSTLTSYRCSKQNEVCCPNGCCLNPFLVSTASIWSVINLLLLCIFFICVNKCCTEVCKSQADADQIVRLSLFDHHHVVSETHLDGSSGASCQYVSPPPTYSVAIHFPRVHTTNTADNRVPTYEEATRKNNSCTV
ncbi:unnamed protein product [Tenebrio molitor]|jgi:hypothetical protein|nr:unnamed protein product [Tenebrio molitor]